MIYRPSASAVYKNIFVRGCFKYCTELFCGEEASAKADAEASVVAVPISHTVVPG